jgi:hypothetical protein
MAVQHRRLLSFGRSRRQQRNLHREEELELSRDNFLDFKFYFEADISSTDSPFR